MGAQLGDDVVFADVGGLVFKPRGQWHTFWNAKDEPCRILEIISPGGLEEFFAELGIGRRAARCRRALWPGVRPREHPAPVRGARPDVRDARRLTAATAGARRVTRDGQAT